MNKNKRLLTIWAVVFNFIAVASAIGIIIWSCLGLEGLFKMLEISMTQEELMILRAENIFTSALDILLNTAAAICLILHVKLYEKRFTTSKKLFIAGLVLNVLSAPISVPSILLYISYFMYMDIKVDRTPENQEPEIEVLPSEDEVKQQVEKLRKLKEEGKISEEEYKEEIMKLL